MREPFDQKVFVWLPGSEDRRAVGTLKYEPRAGLGLSVIDPPWAAERDGESFWPTLHGETLPGAPFTLFDVARRRSGGFWFSEHTQAELVARRLIGAVWLEHEDDLRVTQVVLQSRGLLEWLTASRQDRSGVLEVPTQRHERVVPLEATVDGAKLRFSLSVGGKTERFRDVRQTSASVFIEAPEALTLSEWRRQWLQPLQDLLTFGNREQTITQSLTLLVPREGGPAASAEVFEPAETSARPETVFSFYQRDLLPASVATDFDAFVRSWFALHRRLRGASRFFFGTLNDYDLPVENRLLNLLAFAETYHRELHDEPPFTIEEHEHNTRAMLGALPDESAISVYQGTLGHANRQIQRERVRWLIERAAETDWRFDELVRPLAKSLIDTRNYLTHWSRKSKWVVEADDLALLVDRFVVVLEANLLLDLGFEAAQVSECLAHGYVWDDPLPPFPDDDQDEEVECADDGSAGP
jgi:hypothetical protein